MRIFQCLLFATLACGCVPRSGTESHSKRANDGHSVSSSVIESAAAKLIPDLAEGLATEATVTADKAAAGKYTDCQDAFDDEAPRNKAAREKAFKGLVDAFDRETGDGPYDAKKLETMKRQQARGLRGK